MKKIILLCLMCFIFSISNGQQVQWAFKVIKFSSDLGGKQNGIKRILGRPDVFPQGGNSGNAWTPKNALDGREMVEVGFENPQTVKQVAVFENLNAGCVTKISVDDGSGSYQTVWTRKKDWTTPTFKTTSHVDHNYYFRRKRRKVQEAPNVFNPGIEYAILDQAIAHVVGVRVEFSFALLPGQKQIDAIGISDSETPIQALINTNPDFENLSAKKVFDLKAEEVSSVTLSEDGQKMYFTNKGSDIDKVYSCQMQSNGNWSIPIYEPNLSSNDTYNHVVFSGANFMVKGGATYTRNSTQTGFDFFEYKNNNYLPVGPLKIAAYNNYDDSADLTISKDGKTIIMGIETDFTQGGSDLYFATRKEDGTYGLLQNLGKAINSASDEVLPQLLSDNKTLLFSSYGFSGYGDFDLFVTYRLDDTWKKWSEPINLGSKINTTDFDGSPFYDENTETLYFTNVIDGKMTCHTIKLPKRILMKN